MSILTILDLSAAFDTIDRNSLLRRLELNFGLDGVVLSWFRSYLTGRQQIVVVRGFRSAPSLVEYGVPPGSVLGPILVVLYLPPLDETFSHHSVGHYAFADDTQPYGHVHLTLFKVLFEKWRNV